MQTLKAQTPLKTPDAPKVPDTTKVPAENYILECNRVINKKVIKKGEPLPENTSKEDLEYLLRIKALKKA